MADNNPKDPRRKKYVEARARGLSMKDAAIAAGYSAAEKAGAHVEKGQMVQQELAAVRKQMAVNSGVTKEAIVQGFVDAADMAKIMGDPQGMVAAWRELGRMLGHYAPEVKKIEKGFNKNDLRKALEDMTDEELQELATGRVIDGEFKRVEDPALPEVPGK